MTITFHNKLLMLVYGCQIAAVAGLIYYWDPVFLLWTVLGKILFYSFGVEIGLHRYLAHRSFTMARWKERILLVLSMFACYGSTLAWCANHRVHHKNADRDRDPHPSTEWFKTWFWIDTQKNVTISASVVKDLIKDPIHKWMRKHYFHVLLGTYLVSSLLFGLKFTIYFFIVPAALAQISGGLINVICHKFGYRSYDEVKDFSRNNFWVNMYGFFVGVGLHNNHHKYPWKHRTLSERPVWHEIDWGGWFIERFLMQSAGQDWGKTEGPQKVSDYTT